MLAFFPSWSGKKSGLIQSCQSETPSHKQKRTSDVAQYTALSVLPSNAQSGRGSVRM